MFSLQFNCIHGDGRQQGQQHWERIGHAQIAVSYAHFDRLRQGQQFSLSLSKNQNVIADLSCRGIEFTILPGRHQFSNSCERQIQEAKKILNSLRQAPDKSIFHQPQSLLELQSKLLLTESVLSLKPTLISSENNKEQIIFPRLFMQPWLPAALVTSTIRDILDGVFDISQTLSQLGKMHNNGRESLRNALIDYLQNAAVRYKSLRAGSRQTKPKELLSPMQGDIVLYKNSDKPPQTRYGSILEILDKNQVKVKTQLFNCPTKLPMHVSTLPSGQFMEPQ